METEKRYIQTEKDPLAIKWAKNRLRVYLLGEPRFHIVTAHKPLLPSFNKAKATMPHKMEKWRVMEMQNVDYLSRHPLHETGGVSTGKIIRWTVNTEHAVVITSIREETLKDDYFITFLSDEVMQKLAKRIVSGD